MGGSKELKKELIAEWHPTKNGDLRPTDVTCGSNRKVWWKCSTCGYEWQAIISHRSRGSGCPFCSGRRRTKGPRDLASVVPQLAAEWHPTQNGDLTPRDVTYGIKKKVWWRCEKGHEWQAAINDRSNGKGCPYCSGKRTLKGETDLATVNPQLAAEWHPTKNGNLLPSDVTSQSSKKVWWLGECGHEWQAEVHHRSQGKGCPYCSGKYVLKGETDLATVNPKLAAEWHPTKNGDLLPSDVTRMSSNKVWWQCSKGHEWQATIRNRSNGRGCPYCAGKKAIKGENDLTTVNPKLAAEWHPIKNGDLQPSDVMRGSVKKVWWKCEKGHEWQATINSRSAGSGCPVCRGRKQKPTTE